MLCCEAHPPDLAAFLPRLRSLRAITLDRFSEPEKVFDHFSGNLFAALLCGRGNDDNSRYAYIGVNPFLMVRHEHDESVLTLAHGASLTCPMDPFHLFGALLSFYSVEGQSFPSNRWGAIGYFSYDAAHCIERLPQTVVDDVHMPYMETVFYKDFFLFDYQRQHVFLIQADLGEGFNAFKPLNEALEAAPVKFRSYSAASPVSCCTKHQYMDLVQRIIDYIKRGDIYEVNLSHRFVAAYQGDEYGIFSTLYSINPAPFSAYLNLGDTIIVSNSPERFLRAEGKWVETRPIKGTISRSSNNEQDHHNRMSLLSSKKDEAELAMIVDLLRNDLGKVCEYGSVLVKEHKRVEGFSNVWHLLSIVEGIIRPDENYASLMRACFPGGSITGCPKIRSMEIIDELETHARNLYTGSIFVANDARFDSNIVIRTIVAKNNTLYFSVGGAVVYDSVPEQEYEETLAKAQSIMKALARGSEQ